MTMVSTSDPLSNRRLHRAQLIIEVLLVIVIGVYTARVYLNPDSKLILGGLEAEWMTNGAYLASYSFHETGRIPLWQPYIGRGEPSVENPIAFILNPFSMIPSLILGPELGVRYGFAIHTAIAGVGGWAIGWLMGMSMPARLLLAVLMLAKGSMPNVAGEGYYQLGINQAYLPWAVVGALAIVRYPKSRTAVALLAVVLTMLFHAGLLYYILPGVILAAGIGLVFAIHISPKYFWGIGLNIDLLKRFALAFALFAALAAVTMLPIALHYGYVGGHPGEVPDTPYELPSTVAAQLFTPERYYELGTWTENYNLFTVPVWFAAILFVLLPPFIRLWSRPPLPRFNWRVVIFALVCGLFFLFWGTSTNPIMDWAILNLPFIGQWRVLARMLAVVSMWLAVLVALRFDSLWRALVLDRFGKLSRNVLRLGIGVIMIGAGAAAAREPLEQFTSHVIVAEESYSSVDCVRWLRLHYPGEINIMVRDYFTLIVYIREKVRFTFRAMDFQPVGVEPTIFPYDLRESYARFALSFDRSDRQYWRLRNYHVLQDSPTFGDSPPCILENTEDALPYAFAAPRTFLETYVPPSDPYPSPQTRNLTQNKVVALPHLDNQIDTIGLTVQSYSDQEAVVVLQEVAWPGWNVSLDGKPARLESVGQLIGVVLPADGADHQIVFRYDPPLFKVGAAITFIATAITALWLLRAERLLNRFRPQYAEDADDDESEADAPLPTAEAPPVPETESIKQPPPVALPFD